MHRETRRREYWVLALRVLSPQALEAMTAQRDKATETSDARSRELDEAKQQLEEARQQLQETRDELAALRAPQLAQAASEPAATPPAGEERVEPPPGNEEAERALEAARQAGLLVQQLQLEAQAAAQQAAAQLTALTSELQVAETAWADESQDGARARASLVALRAEVHEAILAPVVDHWPAARAVPADEGPSAADAILYSDAIVASTAESEEEVPAGVVQGKAAADPGGLDGAAAHVRSLLARDALERQLLLQALAQCEKEAAFAADAAAAEAEAAATAVAAAEAAAAAAAAAAATPAAEPPAPAVQEDKGVAEAALKELQAGVQAAREAAAAATDAAQERLEQQQATALLAAVLHNGLTAATEHHEKELELLRAHLAQSQADAVSSQEAEAASKQENAALLNTLAGERDAVKELERQVRAPSKEPSSARGPAVPRALLADQGT